jgi:ligand-binding sensor domain-containing protein
MQALAPFRFAAPLGILIASAVAGVPEPALNPVSMRLPMIDGKGIRFTRISEYQGLSQTRVAQIVQDDLGFMWFATQYGLNRYDGCKFRVFVHNPDRLSSLGCAFIHALFKDRSGILWIGCDQSLDKFDPTTEEFTHYRIASAESGAPIGVFHISQDHDGMMWLATGAGLYRFRSAHG